MCVCVFLVSCGDLNLISHTHCGDLPFFLGTRSIALHHSVNNNILGGDLGLRLGVKIRLGGQVGLISKVNECK